MWAQTYFLVFLDFWRTTFTSFFGHFYQTLLSFNLILTLNLFVRLVEQALVCFTRIGIRWINLVTKLVILTIRLGKFEPANTHRHY